MATTEEKIKCQKCGKLLKPINFYTYKNGDKTEMCKGCLTMHVDNFNPDTFLWLLEKLDVPYIPTEWNVLRDRAYAKDPFKMNGLSVFGKYLSKMKLNQWKAYGWADTEQLSAESAEKAAQSAELEAQREALVQEQYERGEINEAEYKTLMSVPTQNSKLATQAAQLYDLEAQNPFNEDKFMAEEDLPDPAAELTDEDKIFLAMKWGRLYSPQEWVALEQKYAEMADCFDIQDSDTISTLKLICKTDLKMNQALDSGDIDGFQKLSKVSESLRKSAKFTAQQNKEEAGNYLDSIGEFVALCEKEGGFIPRFCTDIPQDKVDLTLQDMNNYTKKLVTEDLGFGAQIETALRKIQMQAEANAEASAKNNLEEEDSVAELIDDDYKEFYDLDEEWKSQDAGSQEEE